MNYKDNYSKNSEYMASDRTENPASGAMPRRPRTNRRFDPNAAGGQAAPPVDGRGAERAVERAADREIEYETERAIEPRWQSVPEQAERRTMEHRSRRKTRTGRAGATNGKTAKSAKNAKSAGPLRVILATVSGLICSMIVLLTCSGLYGMWCYSQGLPGDMNVKVSTAMYCLAAMCGGLWAGAVVRRRSIIPAVAIAVIFMVTSIVMSLQLFEPGAMKAGMICIKVLLTAGAVFGGFWLSVLPYLLRRKRR